jgi:phospholipase/carboxylesterase
MPISNTMLPPECLAEGFYTADVETMQGCPVHTFVPTGYEPNYPYPLIVFLHGHGGNEKQALRLAPEVSRRNYICIAVRGPHSLGPCHDNEPGFGWGAESPCSSVLEDYILRAVEQTRRRFHVHSERIFLAGLWEGATVAYHMALTFPDKFGGVVALNGRLPRKGCPLFRLSELRQLRVLIGHGTANPVVPISLARQDYRLLYTAGMPVRLRTYTTTHRLHADMLRDMDQWIQQSIEYELV